MKKIFQVIGTICLSVATLITIVGPTSVSSIAVEEMPESIKNKR
jgi:hypothetical protein